MQKFEVFFFYFINQWMNFADIVDLIKFSEIWKQFYFSSQTGWYFIREVKSIVLYNTGSISIYMFNLSMNTQFISAVHTIPYPQV